MVENGRIAHGSQRASMHEFLSWQSYPETIRVEYLMRHANDFVSLNASSVFERINIIP